MFDNYYRAKTKKMPVWAPPLVGAGVAIHVALFVGMWIKTTWDIKKLEVPDNEIELALAPPPPPVAAPPAGAKKPQNVEIKVRKIKVKDIVQPVKIEKIESVEPETSSDPDAPEGGEGTGGDGVAAEGIALPQAPPPPPPPPPPAPPAVVAPTALEQMRVAGEKLIVPDDVTKTEISRSGKSKLVTTYKICINVNGDVSQVNMLKSSGFPSYDSKIQREMRGWKYRPFSVDGQAKPVCTSVTFIYQQKN
jgi:periplasmic protein TonB